MNDDVDQQIMTFPMRRTCPFHPPPQYRELREKNAITRALLPSGRHAWLVTRHEDARAMLTDPRFSSDRRRPGFPLMIKGLPRVDANLMPSLIGMDPPEHGSARRAVVAEFTVRRMQALRPRIQEIVDDRIDAMLAGPRPVDLVPALALPVPSLVICELLGVPYADHEFFQSRSALLLNRGTSADERQAGIVELRSYLGDLVTGKQREPGEDLLGRQVRRQRRTGTQDHTALVDLAFLLLIAGHETTANMISLGTVALLEHPDQLAIVKADPGRTPDAVEELLRYLTIADTAAARVAVEDVELAGVSIRAGEGVIALGNAANRDPAVFDEPDTLNVERGARHHVAFGFGAHQCLGQNLARMELQITFDSLFRRIPDLRLATTVGELQFKDDAFVYGVHALPVTW